MDPTLRKLDIYGVDFQIKQDFSGDYGKTVWDCAIVLIKYFENIEEFPYPDFWKNKRVLELGAGTGVVGIALSILTSGIHGFHMTITDKDSLIDFIKTNAYEVNMLSKSKVDVVPLKWGDPLIVEGNEITEPFDMIVMSDIVVKAYTNDFAKLIETLKTYSNENTRIILSYELRDKEELKFFNLLKENNFTYEKVPPSKLNRIYNAEEIGIFEIKRI